MASERSARAGGDGIDLGDDGRPEHARQVVTHPGESDESRPRHRACHGQPAGHVDQRVGQTVHDDGGHGQLSWPAGAVCLGRDGPQVATLASRIGDLDAVD
jgi:hypothetical protein